MKKLGFVLMLVCLLIPVRLMASEILVIPFDDDFNATTPVLSPDTVVGTISHTVYAVGTGSASRQPPGPTLVLDYDTGVGSNVFPQNEGTIIFYTRFDQDPDVFTNDTYVYFTDYGPKLNYIWIDVLNEGTCPGCDNVLIVSIANESAQDVCWTPMPSIWGYSEDLPYDWQMNTWYKIVITWKWNDPNGFTRVYVNDVILDDSICGRENTRGPADDTLELNIGAYEAPIYFDDLRIYDTSNVCCGIGPSVLLTLDYPFGGAGAGISAPMSR